MSSDALSVSVILAVKNGARFLRETLESVLAQTRTPLEIIVTDDQSTDTTRSIAESFGAPVRYICNDPPLGIAGSRNSGIRLARGELIAFTSHDDLWLPEKLQRQCDAFACEPDLECCLTHLRCFTDANEAATPAAFPNDLLERDVPGWVIETLVARRSAFQRAGFFDESFVQGDDTEWYARVRQLGLATLMLPDVLVRKRLHSRSVTYGATKPGVAKRETLEIARRMIAARRGES